MNEVERVVHGVNKVSARRIATNINKENCKLITFQHKSVLSKLLAYGEYYCNIESKYNRRFHICYSNLIKQLKHKPLIIKGSSVTKSIYRYKTQFRYLYGIISNIYFEKGKR